MNIRDDSTLMQLEMSKTFSNSESLRTAKASENEYEDYIYDYGGGGNTGSRRQQQQQPQQQPQMAFKTTRRRNKGGRLGVVSSSSAIGQVSTNNGGHINRNFNIRGSLSSKHGGGHKGCNCKESREHGVTKPPIIIVQFTVSKIFHFHAILNAKFIVNLMALSLQQY